jgi:hypothetical protein
MANATTATKVEFASREFLDVLQAAIREVASVPEAKEIVFSMSECWHDVPSSISASGEAGFTSRMNCGTLQFTPEPSTDVDVRIDADYTALLPLARFVAGGDPERQKKMNGMMMALVQAGKMTITGDVTKIPALTAGIHDRCAEAVS